MSNPGALLTTTKHAATSPGRRALLLRLLVLALCLSLLYGVALWMVVTVPATMRRPTSLTLRFHDQTECLFDKQTESVVFFTRHNGNDLTNCTVVSIDTRNGRLYREAWQDAVACNCELGTFECMSLRRNKAESQVPAIEVSVRTLTLPELKKVGPEIETIVEPDILYWRSLFLKLRGNQLTVEEPVSRETIRKLVLADDAASPSITPVNARSLILITFTNSVTGPPQNSGPPIKEHRLLALEGTMLKEVYRWTGPWLGSYSDLQLNGEAFATLDTAGETLDVISLEDFSLIRQIKGLAANNVYVGDSWYRESNGGQIFDLLTDELLPVAADEAIVARETTHGRIAKTFNDGGTRGPALLIDETSGETLAKLPRDTQRAWFVSGGDEMLAATWSGRVVRYDARTGKRLKVIDPYAYARWLWLPMCCLFVLWIRAWLSTAALLYHQAWVDMVVVTGLIISLVILRPHFAGDPTNTFHFAYRMGQGVFAGWMFLAAMWVSMGSTRLGLRLAAPLVCMSLVALLALAAVGNREPAFWGLIYGGALLCLVTMLSWWLVRRRGWRVVRPAGAVCAQHAPAVIPSNSPRRDTKFRLGDLFIMTGVIACLAAVLRWAPGFATFSPSVGPHLMDAMLIISLVAVGLAAAFAALRDGHRPRVQLISLCAIVLIAALLNYELFRANFGRNGEPHWQPDLVKYELLPFLFMAFTVYVASVAYERRGWRLARVENRSHGVGVGESCA